MSISLKLITNRTSFGSHVATVQAYLNWYRNNDSDKRKEGTKLFSEYLIFACWHKMERRIGHWAAVGLMHNLCTLSDIALSSLAIKDETVTKSDYKLSLYLRAMEKNDTLEEILRYHPYVIPSDAIVPDLLKDNSTKTKMILPCLQRICHESPHKLYNKKNAIEFHYFLVAVMLCYARALRKLHVWHKSTEEENMLKNDKLRKDKVKNSKVALKKTKPDSDLGEFDNRLEDAMAAFDGFATRAPMEDGREEEEEEEEEDYQKTLATVSNWPLMHFCSAVVSSRLSYIPGRFKVISNSW